MRRRPATGATRFSEIGAKPSRAKKRFASRDDAYTDTFTKSMSHSDAQSVAAATSTRPTPARRAWAATVRWDRITVGAGLTELDVPIEQRTMPARPSLSTATN